MISKITEQAVRGQAAKASFINDIVAAVNALIDLEVGGGSGMTDAERTQLAANTANITSLLSAYNALDKYKHVFMEEDAVNALTTATTQNGILYFGMEPIAGSDNGNGNGNGNGNDGGGGGTGGSTGSDTGGGTGGDTGGTGGDAGEEEPDTPVLTQCSLGTSTLDNCILA